MNEWFGNNWQWVIATIITLVSSFSFFIGRVWEKRDYRTKKDKDTFQKFQEVFPADNPVIHFLRHDDIGLLCTREFLISIKTLSRLLDEPTFFFLDKKIENEKTTLKRTLDQLLDYTATRLFPSDRNPGYVLLIKPSDTLERRLDILSSQGVQITCEMRQNEFEKIQKNYRNNMETLNQLAIDVYNAYVKLRIVSHKRL